MYERHFGLRALPFGAMPDPGFYVNLLGHHRALNTLVVALRNGEGIVKIVGEVGTGKSVLCRKLVADLGGKFVSAYLPFPALSPMHIQLDLAEELGVVLPPKVSSHHLMKYLQEVLIDIRHRGQQCVVIVDEAQALSDATLECIRLMSNLEYRGSRLLQIVLVGQPELNHRIEQPCLRQLNQRIAFGHELEPIDRATTEAYIRARLSIAGYSGGDLFSNWATSAICRASRGIPRLINTLSHKSMICAFGRGEYVIRHAHVRKAMADGGNAQSWRRITQRPRRRRAASRARVQHTAHSVDR